MEPGGALLADRATVDSAVRLGTSRSSRPHRFAVLGWPNYPGGDSAWDAETAEAAKAVTCRRERAKGSGAELRVNWAEPAVAADRAGITAFRGSTPSPPALLLN